MLEALAVHARGPHDPPRYRVPHPLGATRLFRQDPLAFVLDVHRRCGDVARFRLAHQNCYLIRDPEHIRHVLVENHENYGKQTLGYRKMSLFLGQGLVTSEGDFWRRQRRIAQPAFHRKRIRGFGETMIRMAADLDAQWVEDNREAPEGSVRDIHHDMMAVTLRIVANTVLSIDVDEREADVGESVSTLLEVFNDSLTRVIPVHEILPTEMHRKWEKARDYLDSMIYGTIEGRRAEGDAAANDDLLGMLLTAVDEETGESMSDLQLRDEVMTMFMAGHETTANALSWTLYELARHPNVRAKLHAEVDAVLRDAQGRPRPPTLEDLNDLPYTAQIIEEGMRLHPPAWIIARSATRDDRVGDFQIRGGSIVFMSPYACHRNPAYWSEPEHFDPDRFSPEAKAKRPRYAYFPFAAGPRVCIGNHFAEMEARVVLATLAQRWDFTLDERTRIDPDPSVTLRPHHELRLRVRPR